MDERPPRKPRQIRFGGYSFGFDAFVDFDYPRIAGATFGLRDLRRLHNWIGRAIDYLEYKRANPR